MAIITGHITRVLTTDDNAIIELSIPSYQGKWVSELDKEELYSFNIKKAKNKKSLNQNNFSWQLMNDIAKELDMFPDTEAVYLDVLRLAKIKTHINLTVDKYFITDEEEKEGKIELTDEELISRLKQFYRVVIIHSRFVNEKGYNVSQVECVKGMSNFSKEDMTAFIERLLWYAEMNGVSTERYEKGLR
jgi:hypothetical protein